MNNYQVITDRIIAELEKGNIPWRKPWMGIKTGPVSHVTGKPYSILNQLVLDRPGEYITFLQCKKEGGKVKKGAKHRDIFYWKFDRVNVEDEDGNVVTDDNGNPLTKKRVLLRCYQVFHIDDCEGIKPKHHVVTGGPAPIEKAEKVLSDYLSRENVKFRNEKGDRAFYRPATDSITVPLIEQFSDISEYYSTVFHEVTHSTGHPKRLNRLSGDAAFGSADYSKEELIAEIGSAVLLNEMGIETPESFRNSSAYIQSWLKVLKSDNKMIVSAAGKADKAARMILGVEDGKEES